MNILIKNKIMNTINPSKWYETAARFGLSAKGVVYCLSGLIAVMAALHFGGNSVKDAGKGGVFGFIEDQPFGKWLLLVVAIGLVCYTIWRWIQAFKDTEHKGSDKKGFSKRFTYFFSGLVYASLAVYAMKIVLGNSSNSGGDKQQDWAAKLLDQPFGQWLVGIVAVIMIGTGLYQLYRAFSGKYKKYVKEALHHDTAGWVSKVGVAGYTARGIVWLILGWMFIKAAFHANAKEAGGSDEALGWLQQSSYGTILLAAVAIGLICYGVFMFLRAKYQEFK